MPRFDTSMNNTFCNIDESDEGMLYGGNNANSLKLRNLLDEDTMNGNIDDYRSGSMRKKRDKRKKKKLGDEIRKITNRKKVNMPASKPYIKLIDGEERLCFKYNTRLSESALNAMPKAELEENEFCVRFDLDSVDISKLNEKFKADNCVYPRANIPYEMYSGNRWNFETECNRLAWQFVSLNPVLLYNKKGLIQRAVDSYRNMIKSSKGQRFYKDDSFYGDIEKRRHFPPSVSSVYIQWTSRGSVKKCKVNVAIENVDYSKIADDFKAKYTVLDEVFDENSFGQERWEPKNADNITAIKIAYINVENTSFMNAIKSISAYSVLKRAVEAYKIKKVESSSLFEDVNAQDAVNDALDKAFNSLNLNDKEYSIFDK